MGIEFEFFEAGCGDSILVSTSEGTNILIDGGVAKTYKKKISSSLDKLYSSLDLVVVTHIDTDHICGIIELLNDTSRRDMIDELWFNTASETMTVINNSGNEVAGGHGNFLFRFMKDNKTPHKNNIYVKENLNDNIFYFGKDKDIKLTLLSPTKDSLKELRDNWNEDDVLKKCQGGDATVGGSTPLEDRRYIDDLYKLYKDKKIKFGGKDTFRNNSSIAFILTYEDKNFLFLGDANIDIINSSLKTLGYSEKEENRLKVEFIKLSHHGSKKNINNEFLNLVKTDTFVVFTNGLHGSKYRHPDKESLMLILKHEKRAEYIKFLFNCSMPIDKKFPFDMNDESIFNFRADKQNYWSPQND
jgi:beta-lactamase superfamily II metal-dependent hydrolase